jgi:hypothetical protein
MASIKSKNATKQLKLLAEYKKKLILPLILLSLASYVVIQFVPLLKRSSMYQQPELWQVSIIGIIVILLSSVFLAYAAKIIGLTRGWLILGVLFSSLIVITKFILVPQSLYSQTYQIGSGLAVWDPNSQGGYISISIILFFAYALILWTVYTYYRDKAIKQEELAANGLVRKGPVIVMVIILIMVAAASAGATILLVVPLLLIGPTVGYIGYVFTGGGFILVASTILAILLSVKYLDHASNIATKTKNGTILAITFWICISLLLMYHVLWVVYMTMMLTVWPFKTISPSGK